MEIEINDISNTSGLIPEQTTIDVSENIKILEEPFLLARHNNIGLFPSSSSSRKMHQTK